VTLQIRRIELVDFRNYERLELVPDEALTVLVGPNAVGKTNVIEAVQLLTAAVSFRRPKWAECIRWGAESAKAALWAEGDGRLVEVALLISGSGRRSYQVNGKSVRAIGDVAGTVPSVSFTPEDLRIVKDSAEKRRDALDEVGDQLSANYANTRAEYERIVRQRNAVLRAAVCEEEELGAWTERLIRIGSGLTEQRTRLLQRLRPGVSEAYAKLSGGEKLETEYTSRWCEECQASAVAEAMEVAIRRVAAEERARGTTLVGPHRDDVVFRIEGRDARTFGSQGQQRTIALAWKLGEVALIKQACGQPPVLLLDDVMSELDEGRRRALAVFVGESTQTIITTTNLGYFEPELIERAKVVSLS